MAKPEEISVEVVYALADEQILIAIKVPAGTSAAAAIARSGLLQRCPGIDPQTAPLGIFGRRIAAGQCLCEGDRVEIYRPLQIDPKDARRARVRRQRGGPACG